MNTTLFLAQFWGWLMLIAGLIFLFKKPAALVELFRLAENRAFTATSSFISLILGLMTILLYNVWVWDWTVIITIFGWLALVKGILRLAFPKAVHQVSASLENKTGLIRILLLVAIVLGVWLLWSASKLAA